MIVNVSSSGAVSYAHNVAYGVGKAGLDKMTADMAHELAPHDVAVVSVWPGLVKTELVMFGAQSGEDGKQYLDVKDDTIKDSGKVGLWSKSDAQTYFDDVKVRDLGK